MTTTTPQESGRAYWPRLTHDGHNHPEAAWREMDLFTEPVPKEFGMPFSMVLKQATQMSLFVDVDSDVLGGTPRIGGTRIPVYMVLNAIGEYGSVEGAGEAYRSLTQEQIRDALRFAVHVLESPFEHESTSVDR